MTPVDWRPIVLEQLELLASKEQQLAYERAVPNVDVTAELLSGWFDDVYHPDAEDFRMCFSEQELRALTSFSAFYQECASHLPPSHHTVRTWLQSPVWQEVMREAQKALGRVQMPPLA